MASSLTSRGLWQPCVALCALAVGVLVVVRGAGGARRTRTPGSAGKLVGGGGSDNLGDGSAGGAGGAGIAVYGAATFGGAASEPGRKGGRGTRERGRDRTDRSPDRPPGVFWGCAAVLAALAAGLAVGPAAGLEVPPPPAGLARVEAVVERVRHRSSGEARSVIRVIKGERLEDAEPFAEGIRLRVGPTPLPEGARITIVLHVRPWMPFRNLSPHPPLPPTVEVQGSGWIPSHSAVRILETGAISGLFAAARRAVRQSIWRTLPPRQAGVASALTLGDGDAVEEDRKKLVRAAGLAHLFAVSGLHVAIVAGLTVLFIRKALLCLPLLARRIDAGRVACAVGAPLALAYAAF
ncbi:MAG: ComEC/Rec2 family competence protein, partial [Planctomycetota bacterium]